MWHATCDMWCVTHSWGWTISQYFSSPALTVWVWQCLGDSERKDDLISEFITKVFKEQPWLHRACLIYKTVILPKIIYKYLKRNLTELHPRTSVQSATQNITVTELILVFGLINKMWWSQPNSQICFILFLDSSHLNTINVGLFRLQVIKVSGKSKTNLCEIRHPLFSLNRRLGRLFSQIVTHIKVHQIK